MEPNSKPSKASKPSLDARSVELAVFAFSFLSSMFGIAYLINTGISFYFAIPFALASIYTHVKLFMKNTETKGGRKGAL